MQAKVLEIRDSCTFIPVLAVQLVSFVPVQMYYLHTRAGHPHRPQNVLLSNLNSGESHFDAREWNGTRTMLYAHEYIAAHWDELGDGDVIDVEFILGEKSTKKTSERYDDGFSHAD